MKRFVLKRTSDGMCHVYLDDPNVEGFLKITSAKEVEILKREIDIFKDFTHFVASDGITKTLYGLMHNEVF
jgi:hypothetical protein